MMMAIDLSIRHGWIDESVRSRCAELLRRSSLPTEPPADMSSEQFLEVMAVDKKALGGNIKLVLLRALGEAVVTSDYDQRCEDGDRIDRRHEQQQSTANTARQPGQQHEHEPQTEAAEEQQAHDRQYAHQSMDARPWP